MTARSFGRRQRRNEDPRLLTGSALFVDDVDLPRMAHAAFVRSPYAHAEVKGIDATAARAMDGVLAVVTAEDLGELWAPGPLLLPAPPVEGATFVARTQVPLVKDRVRHAGEPVALVVAESRYLAEDAAEAVEVDYEPLPAVVDLDAAVREDSPRVHDDLPADHEPNVAARVRQTKGDYEAAKAGAALVLSRTLSYDRGTAAAMENRGLVADWDRRAERLTLWDTTQAPIPIRNGLAAMLGLSESQVRVIAPFIGGAFGPKIMMFYPEEVVVPWAAMTLGRPVKWIEDREENFFATTQERGQVHRAEAAFDAEGRILGIRDVFLHDNGAYNPYGLTVPINSQCTLLGPYRIDHYDSEFRSVYTHKPTVTPYRGAGRQHGVFVVERLLDLAARELSIDPAEIRRRNFLKPEDFPHDHQILFQDFAPLVYDSGDYEPALDKALEAIGYRAFKDDQQPWLRSQGKAVGIAVVSYIEGTGIGPYEGARVQVEAGGRVSLVTGVGTQGQGHMTAFAQVVAEQLGVAVEDIDVVTGDTDLFHWGAGTFASRGAVVAGNAVHQAARRVREKALALAAQELEVAAEDLELEDGRVAVRGVPGRSLTLAELAARANPMRGAVAPGTEPGLEATDYFGPEYGATASGVHAMVVEVDRETFQVEILRYVVVHDCGTLINPLIVDGQIHGGVAQGLGNAFYEELVFDDGGQLLNASLMDFLLPTALDVPRMEVDHHETPSPLNPLGVKGVGEAGAIPVAALFAQAVEDALGLDGLEILEAPLKPSRLWELTRSTSTG